MSSQALEPKLTGYDLTVLRAVPAARDRTGSSWMVAKEVRPDDLEGFLATLMGLQHLGYVEVRIGRVRVWRRTAKGDRAVR